MRLIVCKEIIIIKIVLYSNNRIIIWIIQEF